MLPLGFEATAQLIAAIAGFAITGIAFAVVVDFSYNSTQGLVVGDDAALFSYAASLADLILLDPGTGWYAADYCESGVPDEAKLQPQAVRRFGLAEQADCGKAFQAGYKNALDYHKLGPSLGRELRADPENDAVDYEEARRMLGLQDGGIHFRLDSEPFLVTDMGSAVAYVAAYTSGKKGEPTEAAIEESDILDILAPKFSQEVPLAIYGSDSIPFGLPGDVFPDEPSVVRTGLLPLLAAAGVPSLENYAFVVFGSGAARHALHGPSADDLLAWVQAGGQLVFLGGDESVNWMKQEFGIELKPSATGPTVDDATDFLLTETYALDWEAYPQPARSWAFTRGNEDNYRVVAAADDQAVLAASVPDAFGEGAVILSAWQPHLLGGPPTPDCLFAQGSAECDGTHLMANLFAVALEDLFLNFGPASPTEGASASVARIVAVHHPMLDRVVEMRVQVTAWRTD